MKKIEAEGKELVLQNGNGDTIIIPKNKREQALKMLKNNDHAGIDTLASKLPYMEDYAEDGTLYPDITEDNTVIAAQGAVVTGGDKKKDGFEKQQTQQAASMKFFESIKRPITKLNESLLKRGTIKEPTVEDIHPSIKEFGDAPVDIPKSIESGSASIKTIQDVWQPYVDDYQSTAEVDEQGFYLTESKHPNPYKHGCLGSACRASDKLLKDLPSYYKIRQDQGIMGVQTSQEGSSNRDFRQLDSWELASVSENMGFGKNIFKPSKNFYDYKSKEDFYTDVDKQRETWSKDFDKVPVGTIFNTGFADEGAYEGGLDPYTKKGDKIKVSLKGGKTLDIPEPEVRTRHSMTSVGLTDEGDHVVYNYGNTFTVGDSDKADYSPKDFFDEFNVFYGTALDEHGGWSKEKIEKAKKHNRTLQSNAKS